jgi:NAD(P) transhydrogenase subunit alpha
VILGIPKEALAEETRVAIFPDLVAKYVQAGLNVQVEAGAGTRAYFSDQAYEKAGATIAANHQSLLQSADIVIKVQAPQLAEVALMKPGATLVVPFAPSRNLELVNALNAKNITSFSLDLLPRIARSQSMDTLSSMSNLAGYKSVVLAASHLGKILPMMTTAAGTIQPARVIVIGAGVAGLQAIATAKRLGGVVIAFDTRPIAAEQVKSLGADFVSLEVKHDTAQDAGGYAIEQTAEFYAHEQEIIQKYAAEADIIITTALIPGKRAPILITEEMVKAMKPGSVIVDLAVEQQGNCVLSEPGKIVVKHNVTLIGILNLPSTVPVHASQLFSKNLYAFVNYVWPQLKDNKLDLSDEIIKGTLVTKDGQTVHPAILALQQKG